MRFFYWLPGLKNARERAGLTVAEAAARLGVSRQCWYNWERAVAVPLAGYLPEMAKILNCRIEDLYAESEE